MPAKSGFAIWKSFRLLGERSQGAENHANLLESRQESWKMAIALITNHSLPSCQTFSFDRLLHYNFYSWRSIARWQTLESLHYLKKIQKACSRCNTPTASIQCIHFQESASIQYTILINKRQLFDLQHFLKDLPHPFKRPQ